MTRPKSGKAPPSLAAMHSELECLRKLQPSAHPNIANLLQTFEGAYELHAILEYARGGSLRRFMASKGHGRGLAEPQAAAIACQICYGLAHMHALGMAHRDVKLENVIFSDKSLTDVKLVDYGFATIHEGRRCRTQCGSPAYMAPEIVKGTAYLAPPVDVWSLGAVLYELLHNRHAFRGDSMPALNTRIMKGAHMPFDAKLGKPSKAAVRKALTVDADERPPAARVAKLLRDAHHIAAPPHVAPHVVQVAPRVASVAPPASENDLSGR